MNSDRKKFRAVIAGSGSYLPELHVPNSDFLPNEFFDDEGTAIPKEENATVIRKLKEITGIEERRYVLPAQVNSDIALIAAQRAIASSQIDIESLDLIIVAHNFGNVRSDNPRIDLVPSLASRVKNDLRIRNASCVAFDLIFGCAGWLEGIIQSIGRIEAGEIRHALIIGSETLSRVSDPHDRDSMIYADGAGAMVIQRAEENSESGFLSCVTKSVALDLAYSLSMGLSNNPDFPDNRLFLKMNGRLLYEFALKLVPDVITQAIEQAGIPVEKIDKLLIHQANTKMDEAILKRVFRHFGKKEIPAGIMPMTIDYLGNTSVATLPTLYDLIANQKFAGQEFHEENHLVFASVGAGVNMNAVVYKV